MLNAALFVEDVAHEAVIGAIVRKVAQNLGIPINIDFRSSRKGFSRIQKELRWYVRDINRGLEYQPDLLIICTDSNCKGYTERRQEIESALTNYTGPVIYAIPDPHVERWLLLDSAAFKSVLGKGCSQPPHKCERDLFKRKLREAIIDAGVRPLIGGIEHADAIINEMDFVTAERNDESMARFLRSLRDAFRELNQ